MSRPDPAAAMNGVGTGHICDSCNRRIQHGDKAGLYTTWYDEGGWTPRRTWCMDCCPEKVDRVSHRFSCRGIPSNSPNSDLCT